MTMTLSSLNSFANTNSSFTNTSSSFENKTFKITTLDNDQMEKNFPYNKSFTLQKLKEVIHVEFHSGHRTSTNTITVTFPNEKCLVYKHIAYNKSTYDKVSHKHSKNKNKKNI